MKYSKFEIMAMGVAACAVLGTALLMVRGRSLASEIVGQLMILVALFGGLHYGRKGAAVGFLTATAVYGVVAFSINANGFGSTAWMFLFRVAIYAAVAFIAGELNVRYRYLFIKLEHHDFVDDVTTLYNSRYLSRLIEREMSEFDRYGSEFSLTSFAVRDELLARLPRGACHKLIKELGNSVIRGNIRGADEAARVETAKFTILFPNTDFDEATCATVRVKDKISGYMKSRGYDNNGAETIQTEILEYPRDREVIEEFAANLSRAPLEGRP